MAFFFLSFLPLRNGVSPVLSKKKFSHFGELHPSWNDNLYRNGRSSLIFFNFLYIFSIESIKWRLITFIPYQWQLLIYKMSVKCIDNVKSSTWWAEKSKSKKELTYIHFLRIRKEIKISLTFYIVYAQLHK